MNADTFSNLLHDVDVTGTITFAGHLTFDGQLRNGDLIGKDLVVGPRAIIQGNIKATSLVVAERCEIRGTASLVGSLIAGRLAVHDGATVLGGIVVTR